MSIKGGGLTHNQSEGEVMRPEFIRAPRKGTRCPITGLSRSSILALILPNDDNGGKPPVKSVVLRKRGNVRGSRLIVVDSLLDYLHRQYECEVGKEVEAGIRKEVAE